MTNRYRPTTFDGVVGQPDVAEIEALLTRGVYDNFLFHGPPGTGKTTVAHIIAREIQGSDELVEFNASDDRGIDMVRDDIIPVANQTTLSGAPMVVFLDEMDSMTKEAQEALRRPMEESGAVFVLACNDPSAVHSAVKSRCRPYEFGPVPEAAVRDRISQIAADEGVDLSEGEMKTIVSFANGDMRAAIKRYEDVANGALADEEPTVEGGTLEAEAHQYLGD